MKEIEIGILAVALRRCGSQASAQDLFVYPEKGQSAEQQEQDEFAGEAGAGE
jgi:hypothetical protein